MDERLFAPVGDPDFVGGDLVEGCRQLVPIGVVGDHQRQFDPGGLGALAHPHPARGQRHHRIGQPARPDVGERRRRGQHDAALERLARHPGRGQYRPQRHAEAIVQLGQPDQRAMQINRLFVSGAPQQRQHALTFAQRIDADEMAAFREQRHGVQQLVDLLAGGRMAEDRQRKGRLGDEQIAILRLERGAGRVWPALVVAGDHDPAAAIIEHDLGAAEHMAGRREPHRDLADRQALAIGERLQRPACRPAVTRSHDRNRLGCGQHMPVAGARVIAMTVRDHGARRRLARIDMEIAWHAIEPRRTDLDPAFGRRCGDRHRGTGGGGFSV